MSALSFAAVFLVSFLATSHASRVVSPPRTTCNVLMTLQSRKSCVRRSPGYIQLNGVDVVGTGQGVLPSGFYFVVLDPYKCQAKSVEVFKTGRRQAEEARLVEFLERLAPGEVVAGFTVGKTMKYMSKNYGIAALNRFGMEILKKKENIFFFKVGLLRATKHWVAEKSCRASLAEISIQSDHKGNIEVTDLTDVETTPTPY